MQTCVLTTTMKLINKNRYTIDYNERKRVTIIFIRQRRQLCFYYAKQSGNRDNSIPWAGYQAPLQNSFSYQDINLDEKILTNKTEIDNRNTATLNTFYYKKNRGILKNYLLIWDRPMKIFIKIYEIYDSLR